MNKRRSPQSYKEFLQEFSNLFDETEPNTPEEIASYFESQGYDRKTLVSSLRADIEKAISESPLNWRNKVDDVDERRSDSSQAANRQLLSRQDIIAAIHGFYAKSRIPLVAHYRNLEEVTDEDLLSLLEDLQELDDQPDE